MTVRRYALTQLVICNSEQLCHIGINGTVHIRSSRKLSCLTQDDLGKLRGYFKTISNEKSKSGELWKEYTETAKLLK